MKKLVLLFITVALITIYMTDDFFKPTQQNNQYPPNVDFKRAVEGVLDEVLADRIFDAVWKNTFHYITFFESLDGFTNSAVVIADAQLTFTTGATTNDLARVVKQPDNQGVITFSQPSRMRSTVDIDQTTAQTIYITVGNVVSGAQGYGFKIVNDSIYGVTHNGSAETTKLLQTLSVDTEYNFEARYLPEVGVSFWIDDSTTTPATLITEKGRITATLPSPAAVNNDNLMNITITTNANAAKVMRMSYFEYLQKRNILK